MRLEQCRRVFFSFPQVTDPAKHPDYNAWHQLDHQPENRALPGVLHGDRWVRTPADRAASGAQGEPSADARALEAADYVAMYWFADPVADSVGEWLELGRTTGELGRRPDLEWTTRRLTGFFRPLEGRVADGVEISASALPFRIHAGVIVEVVRVAEPSTAGADAALRAWHREHLAAVRRQPGVAGTWTFASRDVTITDVEPVRSKRAGEYLVALHFCESAPADVLAAVRAPALDGLTSVLRTPVSTITPFAWDWFA
ncbi:hypothetical protein NODU109028_12830 [Nocardioides dubius]|uniref:YCII-related domain-containing protein n=1 Tax=Nocardioides dubius TaxID=317019 RepID=A0ABN1TX93_9ACTN